MNIFFIIIAVSFPSVVVDVNLEQSLHRQKQQLILVAKLPTNDHETAHTYQLIASIPRAISTKIDHKSLSIVGFLDKNVHSIFPLVFLFSFNTINDRIDTLPFRTFLFLSPYTPKKSIDFLVRWFRLRESKPKFKVQEFYSEEKKMHENLFRKKEKNSWSTFLEGNNSESKPPKNLYLFFWVYFRCLICSNIHLNAHEFKQSR